MKTQLNGITLAYSDRGRGMPVVFLHAFPLNRWMWESQQAGLSSRYRTIAVDLRGHGESDAPYWRYSLEQYADDVRALLEHLQIRKAVFVGLSMGGYLAFTLCRRHPDLIQGLVFADTRAEADKPEQSRWRFDLAQRAGTSGPSAVVADMGPKMLAPARYARDPELVERVYSMIASTPVPGIVGDLMAMAERPDSTGILGSIGVPTLAVNGKEDVLTTPADAERIARGITGAQLVLIPDAGHLSNMEQPELFNQALEEFLAGIGANKRER
ncbi:MAG TPA: alpha/beta fold hydrolase [Nitrospira sp.]|nr:alpha/beta fold hydrolase [Nitrospira sp.]